MPLDPDTQKAIQDAVKAAVGESSKAMSAEMAKLIPTAVNRSISDLARQRGGQPPAKQPQQQAQQQQPKKEEKQLSEDDLEKMSRAEFMEYSNKRLLENLQESVLKPLAEQIDEVRGGVTRTQLEKRVEEARTKYKDFDEWREEMGQMLQQDPSLANDPARLYRETKEAFPQKVQELEAKAKEAEVEKAQEEGSKQTLNRPAFGGLTPTSGVTSKSSSEKKDFGSAFDQAWDEVMADIPSEIIGTA